MTAIREERVTCGSDVIPSRILSVMNIRKGNICSAQCFSRLWEGGVTTTLKFSLLANYYSKPLPLRNVLAGAASSSVSGF